MTRGLLPGAALLAVAGCASMQTQRVRYRPVFRYELVEVQRSAATRERYGEHRIEPVAGTAVFRVEDQLARVEIEPVQSRFALTLVNRTEAEIRIPWSAASYIGIAGDSQPVMHRGEKYTECSSRKTASVIASRASLTEEVMPCGAVRATYSTWFAEPLLPEMRIEAADTARVRTELSSTIVGKQFHLHLPLEVGSMVHDYRFTFAITGFDYRPVEF